jgi:hypothetical protein
VPAAPHLLILGSVEAIIIAQWAQWSLDCIMWNHSIIMHTGRYWQQRYWNWGLFSSSAEVSGYLEYQLHIKGTVLYLWCSQRCIMCWIVIYYRGLKFPQKALVLLLLEGDATCTSLNGHFARESAVLIFEWCFKAKGDIVEDLRRYWPPEGCIKKLYDKPTCYSCLCKKCWLWEQQNSDIAVSCNLAKYSDIQCEIRRFGILWSSQLTRISINAADSSLLHLLFLMSLSILSGWPIINICSCHQDIKFLWIGPMAYHRHTGFYYS